MLLWRQAHGIHSINVDGINHQETEAKSINRLWAKVFREILEAVGLEVGSEEGGF